MTTFSDDFNRADGALGANWVLVSGPWVIASNQLSPGASGATIVLRAATAMAGSDNFAQITIAATTPVSQGVWCRGDATLANGYVLRNDGTTWAIFKVVSGTFTSIGTFTAAAVAGDIAKIQAVGSTITGTINGVARITLTDTAVTSGTSVGLRSMSTSGLKYDNFVSGDVVTGATLGLASSIETAQPLTGGVSALLGPAAEVEAAQPLTGAKAASLTVAAVVETAQPLTGLVRATLGAAGAVETARLLTGGKSAALGPALEAVAAQAFAGLKSTPLPFAASVETARALAGYVPVAPPVTGTARAGLPSGPSAAAGSPAQPSSGAGIGSSAQATGGSSS